MSEILNYSKSLNEKDKNIDAATTLEPLQHKSKKGRIQGIKAILFDVYGTLINYWKEEFQSPQKKRKEKADSLLKTAREFHFLEALKKFAPAQSPETTLNELYDFYIKEEHKKLQREGIAFPEVCIISIWQRILNRIGICETDNTTLKKIAYFFNFHLYNRGLYQEVSTLLPKLRAQNIKLGIISNAQFYTPIDLALHLSISELEELFDPAITLFSFKHKRAKPDEHLFSHALEALAQQEILPQETLYVGNDIENDIIPAQKAGMKTALFSGDKRCTFLGKRNSDTCLPDINIRHYGEFLQKTGL